MTGAFTSAGRPVTVGYIANGCYNFLVTIGTKTFKEVNIMAYCSQCGANINQSDRFCSGCGQMLGAVALNETVLPAAAVKENLKITKEALDKVQKSDLHKNTITLILVAGTVLLLMTAAYYGVKALNDKNNLQPPSTIDKIIDNPNYFDPIFEDQLEAFLDKYKKIFEENGLTDINYLHFEYNVLLANFIIPEGMLGTETGAEEYEILNDPIESIILKNINLEMNNYIPLADMYGARNLTEGALVNFFEHQLKDIITSYYTGNEQETIKIFEKFIKLQLDFFIKGEPIVIDDKEIFAESLGGISENTILTYCDLINNGLRRIDYLPSTISYEEFDREIREPKIVTQDVTEVYDIIAQMRYRKLTSFMLSWTTRTREDGGNIQP